MILYPAIDLKDGQAVRLVHGEMDSATVFNDDPAAQARAFADAGCEWIHLVDLNGAFAGRPVNAAAVEAILAAIDRPAQLGGGIRDIATIEAWLRKGLARVILGTVAVEDPDLVRDAARAFPGQVAVGRPSSIPISTATARWAGPMWTRPRRWPAPWTSPSSPRAACPRWRICTHWRPPA